MKLIDTHQHLIYLDRFDYPWLESVPALRTSFVLEDYQAAMQGIEVESLFMEVDVHEEQSALEASFFCELAGRSDSRLRGVIASGRPENDGFEQYLDSIANPYLKGFRRVLHTQGAELSTSSLFRENIKLLGKRSLSFDLCVSESQHDCALELVRNCPETTFVLDHCGGPDLLKGTFAVWKRSLKRLAQEPNLYCKISGIVAQLSVDDDVYGRLSPYLDACLECFGPGRLLWGSDWPVCELGSGLSKWIECSHKWADTLNLDERSSVFHDNAAELFLLR